MRSREMYYVSPYGRDWEVKGLFSSETRLFRTREAAEAYALRCAKESRPCRIVVVAPDGRQVSSREIGPTPGPDQT
jgi:hypothetical protein